MEFKIVELEYQNLPGAGLAIEDVRAEVQSAIADYLPLSGGTLSGNLQLGSSSPVKTNGAYSVQLGDRMSLQNIAGSQAMIGNNVTYGPAGWQTTNAGNAAALRMYGDTVAVHISSPAAANSPIAAWDASDVKMAVKSSGNVGIGTSNPQVELHVSGNSEYPQLWIQSSADGVKAAPYMAYYEATAGRLGWIGYGDQTTQNLSIANEKGSVLIQTVGNVGIGTHAPSESLTVYPDQDDRNAIIGRVFLGAKASVAPDHMFLSHVDCATRQRYAFLQRSDGLTNVNSPILIQLAIGNATKFQIYSDGHLRPSSDNTQDLGLASRRFDDIYATNGAIQTSDGREKQDIRELSEAEIRVAKKLKSLIRSFRWKTSVEEKGDRARTHFGIIAQDLQKAFEEEGLDASQCGLFTHTTWWEVERVELERTVTDVFDKEEEAPVGAIKRERMGVRYDQLWALIIAGL